MQATMLKSACFLFGGALLLGSCREAPDYPSAPAITFHQLHHETKVTPTGVRVDSLRFTIKYTDGDADLGLGPAATVGDPTSQFPEDFRAPFNGDTTHIIENGNYVTIINPYFYNWWMDIYLKKNGVFEKYNVPTSSRFETRFSFNGRIPRLVTDGRKEPIDGQINYSINLTQAKPPRPGALATGDTIFFKIRILDRALHVSNEVQSPVIVLGKP